MRGEQERKTAFWGRGVVLGLLCLALTVAAVGEEQAFDLFPMSKPWRDVRIPRYDEKDVLTSMMHTEALTRQDEKELKLEGLTLVMFQASGEMTLRLKTKLGLYDVGASMLRTHSTTFIEHEIFEMKGNRMRFDTAAQRGTLEGNVEMLIYSVPLPVLPMPAGEPVEVEPGEVEATGEGSEEEEKVELVLHPSPEKVIIKP